MRILISIRLFSLIIFLLISQLDVFAQSTCQGNCETGSVTPCYTITLPAPNSSVPVTITGGGNCCDAQIPANENCVQLFINYPAGTAGLEITSTVNPSPCSNDLWETSGGCGNYVGPQEFCDPFCPDPTTINPNGGTFEFLVCKPGSFVDVAIVVTGVPAIVVTTSNANDDGNDCTPTFSVFGVPVGNPVTWTPSTYLTFQDPDNHTAIFEYTGTPVTDCDGLDITYNIAIPATTCDNAYIETRTVTVFPSIQGTIDVVCSGSDLNMNFIPDVPCPDLLYQWHDENNIPIPGETGPTISLTEDGNLYTLEVSRAAVAGWPYTISALASCCQAPEFIFCPTDLIVTTTSPTCLTVNYPTPVATSNCEPVTVTQIAGLPSGSAFPLGTPVDIVFEAENANGQTSLCSFTITLILDTELTLFCPFDVNICSDPGTCSWIGEGLTPITSANCGSLLLSYQVSGATVVPSTPGTANGVVFNQGISFVTYTLTDPLNLTLTEVCTFSVTVNDCEGPILTCPVSITNVECGTEDLITWAGTASALDVGNCNFVDINYFLQSTTELCGEAQIDTYLFIATDAAGNSTSCVASYGTVDTSPPTITNPASGLDLECDGSDNATEILAWLNNNGGATATDDCSPVFWSNDYASVSNPCVNGVVTITFTATDECGNSVITQAVLTINDTTAPTWLIDPANITIECDGTADPLDQINAWLTTVGGGEADDDCSFVAYSNDFTALSNGCGATGTATVTFTASDACGNPANAQATVTVVDNTPPSIELPAQDLVVECNGNGNTIELTNWLNANGNAVANDACSSTFTWANSLVSTTSTCGGTQIQTYTFTATDECGNTSVQTTADFIIEDTTPPVITPPNSLTVQCDGNGNLIELNQWLSIHGGASATDLCSAPLSWGYVLIGNIESCGLTGSKTYRFIVADDCGNTSSAVASFTIVDTTVPSINTVAQSETVECDGNGNAAELLTWLNTNGGAVATDLCGEITWSNNYNAFTYDCAFTGSTTVTFTATDECGNESTTTATFTIEDTTNPELTVPPGIELECSDPANDEIIALWLLSAYGSDGCGDITITNNFSNAPFAAACGLTGVYTVTFTATDDCSLTTSLTSTITIVDTEDPEFVVLPQPLVVDCDDPDHQDLIDAWVAVYANAIAVDDCGTVTLSITVGQTQTICGGSTITEYTVTATDQCGNAISEVTTVTVEDTTPPVITLPVAPDQVYCDDDVVAAQTAWLQSVAAIDECGGGVSIQHYLLDVQEICAGDDTHINKTYLFEATDECGNVSTAQDVFTIFDNISPVITAPADLVLSCGDEIGAAVANWLLDYTVVEACQDYVVTNDYDGTVPDLCGGSLTVTWTVTDPCGASSSASADLIITDDVTGPVFQNCPDDLTVNVDIDLCGTNVVYSSPVAFDCNGPVTVVQTSPINLFSGDEFPLGDTEITFTATDACDNISTCTFTLTVVDSQIPSLSCPSNDVVVCASDDDCDWVGDTSVDPIYGDNCVGYTLTYSILDPTGNVLTGAGIISQDAIIFALGTSVVTYTLTDGSGNQISCSFNVIVEDCTAPVITCPAVLVLECADVGNEAAIAAWTATATDNCDQDVVIEKILLETNYNCGNTESRFYLFIATDDAGNQDFCFGYVNIYDTTVPIIDIPAQSETVECNGNGNVAELIAWLVTNGGAVATDLCGEVTWSNNYNAFTYDCAFTGSTTVTFTATDECGNESITTATFTIEDTTNPELTVPPGIELECTDPANDEIIALWLLSAYGSDGCGDITITNNFTTAPFAAACGLTGVYTVTFTATDDCSLTTSLTSTITIVDTEDPEFVVLPQPLVVDCDDPDHQDLIDAWVAIYANAIAVDECGDVTLSITAGQPQTICGGSTITEYTITAIDECGNSTSEVTTVTVEDTTPPVITLPVAPDQVYCDDDLVAAQTAWVQSVTAVDFCGGDVSIQYYLLDIQEICVGDDTHINKSYLFEAIDECGNISTALDTFTIYDDVSPVIIAPDDLVLSCEDEIGAAVAGWLLGYTVIEACQTYVVTNDFDGTIPDLCGGSLTVTWTVTDQCGATTSASADLIITDDVTGPVFQNCPGDLTVNVDIDLCGTNVVYSSPVAFDCNGPVTVEQTSPTNLFSGDEFPLGDTEITFTATDACGNTSTCTFTLTVVDSQIPSLSCPSNDVVVCASDDDCDWVGDTSVDPIYGDNCVGYTLTYSILDPTGNVLTGDGIISQDAIIFALGTSVVTYTLTDGSGNQISCSFNVIVEDCTAPVITCPAVLVLECADVGNEAAIAAWTATATDNCDQDVVIEKILLETNYDCGNTESRFYMFIATDDAGNQDFCFGYVNIYDTTVPIIDTPAQSETVECNGNGNVAELIAWLINHGGAEATDLCGEVTWSNDYNAFPYDCAFTGSITVTFTATDDCGNSVTTIATFTIIDETPPSWEILPANLTIECDGSTDPYGQIQSWLNTVGGGDAEDDCSLVTYFNNYNGLSGGCSAATGSAVVTFTARDSCLNEITAQATVTMVDNAAPNITSPALDQTVECNGLGNTQELQAWLDNNAGATATDICGAISWLTPVLLNTIEGCGNTAEYIYQFQSMDECNNLSAITIASFIIEDTEPPYWTAYPQDATAECGVANTAIMQWLTDFGGGVVTDACGGGAAATTYFTDVQSFLIASGNPSMESFETFPVQAINVIVTPGFTVSMLPTGANNIRNAPYNGSVATDGVNYVRHQSDAGGTLTFSFNTNINSFGLYLTDYGDFGNGQLTFSNSSGDSFVAAVTPQGNGTIQFFGVINSAMSFNQVVFTNSIPGEAYGFDQIYYGTVPELAGMTLETEVVSVIDGCGNTGTYEYRFRATDVCGNDTSWVATFTVTDLTPPVIVAPNDLTISCLPNQQSNLSLILDWLDDYTASDECSTVTVTHNFEEGLIDFCTGEDLTVTWTAVDECGNISTATAILIVEQDLTGPTWDIAPQNLTIECGPNAQATVNTWVAAFGNGIASDGCTSQVSYSILNAISGTGCGGTYSGNYTFVATDGCGNDTPYTASFSVVDTQAPVITSPAQDLTVECDGQGNTAELSSWLANHGGATASDVCDDNLTWSYTLISDVPHCGGTSVRRYSFVATDGCNNASPSTQATFTIKDTIVPQITVQASTLVVDCDGQGNLTQKENWLNGNGGAFAFDICSGLLTWDYDLIDVQDSCSITGRWTYKFTARDACGNVNFTIADFVIRDITAPAITNPAQPLIVECDGANNASEIINWLNNNGFATATDACGAITWTNNYGTIIGGCGTTGAVLVTFTATDACGNSSSTSSTFTINDTFDPIWEKLPSDLTIECDGTTDPYSQIEAWLNEVGGAEAKDDCSYIVYTNNFELLSDGCSAGTGIAVVTFTATDACGNFIIADATVSVVDNSLPLIYTAARDTIVECDGEGNLDDLANWLANNGGAVAVDDCSEPITWESELLEETLSCGSTFEALYSFRAIDACGNVSANTMAKFKIITTMAYLEILVQDTLVQCDGAGNVDELTGWLAMNTDLIASDPCFGNATIEYDLVSETDLCSGTGDKLYRFSAIDDCGNILNSAEATFTIVDTLAPVITGGEDMIMEECIDPPAGNYPEFDFWLTNNAGATAEDVCGSFEWSNNFHIDNWIQQCGNTKYVDVTFYATDICGNVDSIIHRFSIGDVTPPEFVNCPRPDIVVDVPTNLCESYVNFSMPYAIDNCSSVVIEQIDTTGLTSGDLFPVGCTILEYTATDSCGNQMICQLRIIVNDNHTPPVIECPADISTVNDPGICGAVIDDIDLKVTDNCPGNVSVTYEVYDASGTLVSSGLENASGSEFPVGENTVVYTAYDQPRFMITEIVQNGFITGVEIGNFGPAAIDLGCMEVRRENSSADELYVIPHGNILTAGTVYVRSFTTIPAGQAASYTLRMKDRLIDSVRINAGLNGVDIFRISPIDTDTNDDFEVANSCQSGSYGLWNPQLPHYTDNGTLTKMQSVKANESICQFNVNITDVESPVCATTDTLTYSAGNIPITPGTCVSSVFTLPAGKIADINLIDLDAAVTNAGKITVTLTSPWGEQITLIENICNNTANIDVKLDDIAASMVSSAGCSPLGNGIEYRPLEAFNTYFGENSLGNWKLEMYTGTPNAGTLNNWSIEFILVTDYDQDDIVVDNDPGECGADVTWTHPYLLDNCEGGTMTVTYSFSNSVTGETSEVTEIILSSNGTIDLDGTIVTRYFEVGVTEITYTLTDIYGNTSVCGFTVTVEDTEAPVFPNGCDDVTIYLDPGDCYGWVNTFPQVTDNCKVDKLQYYYSNGVETDLTYIPIGDHTILAVATDIYGNKDTCIFVVHIIEYIPTNLALSCNNSINISLDAECKAELNADMLLEGNNYRCYENYCITVTDANGQPHGTTFGYADVGQTFMVTICDCLGSGNCCMGQVTIMEKFEPEIECPADTAISCNSLTDPDVLGYVKILNCEPFAEISYSDDMVDNGACGTPRATIYRTWSVDDKQGNVVTCVQEITIKRSTLDQVVFPVDMFDMDCKLAQADSKASHPDKTGYPKVDGIPINYNTGLCMFSFLWTDEIYNYCGNSYEILRTWKVRDMCGPVTALNPRVYVQVIRVFDTAPPQICSCEDIVVDADSYRCEGSVEIPAPCITENCSPIKNVKLFVSGAAVKITGSYAAGSLKVRVYNMRPGVYAARWVVVDECNNKTSCEFDITVLDKAPPIAICEQFKTVSLTTSGTAKVFAEDFDSGSFDNCNPVWFKVLRVDAQLEYDGGCADLNGDDHPKTATNDVWYDDEVYFCCEDLGSTVMVNMRVFDKDPGEGPVDPKRMLPGGDLYGHYNDCWNVVTTECKMPPLMVCKDVTITCEESLDPAENAALAILVSGVCDYELSYTDVRDNGVCKADILRTWTAKGCDKTSQCKQKISVTGTKEFDPCTVLFPADKTVECSKSINDGSKPLWDENPCNIVTAEIIREDTFMFVEGACYKILREWAVIDWCKYEKNTGAEANIDAIQGRKLNCNSLVKDGYYRYTQVLKVVDLIPPVITVEERCVSTTDCYAYNVEITATVTDTCNSEQEFWWKYKVEDLNCICDPIQVSYNFTPKPVGSVVGKRSLDKLDKVSEAKLVMLDKLPAGNYKVTWTVGDGCGNATSKEQFFTVADRKAPTPVLVDLASAVMENGMVELTARSFDKGGCGDGCISSLDNCTESSELYFTFTPVLPDIFKEPIKWANQYAQYGMNYYDPVTGEISTQAKYLSGIAHGWLPDLKTAKKVWLCEYVPEGNIELDVQVYVWDQFALNTSCNDDNYDYGIVRLSLNHCGSSEISGTVKDMNSNPFREMNVYAKSDEAQYMKLTDDQGNYSVVVNPDDYTVTANSERNYVNGVSTLDIVILQKHLLGLKQITDPYKLLAADANATKTVTTSDILEIRKLILSVNDKMKNYSWLGIGKDYEFKNPYYASNEYDEAQKITLNVGPDTKHTGIDYIAIKIGDLNNSANVIENRSDNDVKLVIDNVKAGKEMVIPVTASSFEEITGFQFTLDLKGIKIKEVTSSAIEIDENHYNVKGDKFIMSWNAVNSMKVKDGEVLFNIIAESAEESGKLSQMIELSDKIARAEIYDKELNIRSLTLEFRNYEFALYQNEPNPFTQNTDIRFDLPETGEYEFVIYDVVGKQVYNKKGLGTRGSNRISVDRTELPANGVFMYNLRSGENTASRKMIFYR